MPRADSDRLYLYGESRGGMMVFQAVRDGFPARAAAVVGAFTDLDAMLADPQWQAAGDAIWPDLDSNRAAIVERRSALRWPERITKPLLLIHGADDRSTPVRHAHLLAAARRLIEETFGRDHLPDSPRAYEKKAKRYKLKLETLAVFTQQLSSMLEAGLPLVSALDALQDAIPPRAAGRRGAGRLRKVPDSGSTLAWTCKCGS